MNLAAVAAPAALSVALAGCGEEIRAYPFEPSPPGSFGAPLPSIPGPTPGLASPLPQGGAGERPLLGEDGAPLDAQQVISDVEITVHPRVNTLLVVRWTQALETERAWLEFGFEGERVMRSAARIGSVGEHRDVVIGVPGETRVDVRIVLESGGAQLASEPYQGTTRAVPSGMPVPEVLAYDPELASPDRWLFGSVEDSDGGCNDVSCYYHTTFWLYIMDRRGRIVWYYADPASNATSSFQRIARDGQYIWIEKRSFGGGGRQGVLKMTLDWSYLEQISVPGLADAIDVTDEGSLLYNVDATGELRELLPDGRIRVLWACPRAFGDEFDCYSNTINHSPRDGTVLLSFPYENTVVEVSRESGRLVRTYGDARGSWDFSPPSWEFEFQHFANITPQGTLLVSSHMPGHDVTEEPVAYEHAFVEFERDLESQTLIEKWVYNEGPEWPMFKGMALRLPGGNTLANYGTGGVIREITPDKRTAFHVKFDSAEGDDFFNKMLGHNVLIDDLYALNGGGPQR